MPKKRNMCGSQRPSRVRTSRSHRPMRACVCTKSSSAARRRISASSSASASRDDQRQQAQAGVHRVDLHVAVQRRRRPGAAGGAARVRRRRQPLRAWRRRPAAVRWPVPTACAAAKPVSASKAGLTQATTPSASIAASATGAVRAQACSAAGRRCVDAGRPRPDVAGATLGLERPSGADMAWLDRRDRSSLPPGRRAVRARCRIPQRALSAWEKRAGARICACGPASPRSGRRAARRSFEPPPCPIRTP